MIKQFRIKFRVNKFWLSPGKIIFYGNKFELVFLWKTKHVIDYSSIINVKKSLYFLDEMLIITTKNYTINLIAGFNFEQLIDQFKSLGFGIEG